MKHALPVLLLIVVMAPGAFAQVDSVLTDTLAVDTLRARTPAIPAAPATAPPVPSVAIEAVRVLEGLRQTAMVAADTKALAEIIAEDATYVHANGLMQTRAQLFSMLESGEMKYVAIKLEDARYRAYDGTVIGTGVQRIDVKSAGKSLALRSRYTVVYVASEAGWKLVAYESTPTPKVTTRQ
ncbi:MAG TPA: nuclear transport factor 2 family protein [Candidatus Krumholzibacteria bacterium]